MARINLTIPDSLYERLDRLRDRVNVSKVCAVALAKELDMLENVTTPAENQMMQRLVRRLRENKDRWYLRGNQDGMEWAADRAAMDELQYLVENWRDDVITDGDEFEEIMNEAHDEGCPSLNAQELLHQWIEKDRNDGIGVSDPNVNWRAYLLGWYHGVRDLWRKSKSSLK